MLIEQRFDLIQRVEDVCALLASGDVLGLRTYRIKKLRRLIFRLVPHLLTGVYVVACDVHVSLEAGMAAY